MNRIKSLRNQRGMKQSDLASRLNVQQGTISNWETGKTEPDLASLTKMATIFEVTADYILGRSSPVQEIPAGIRIPVLGSVPAGIPLEAIEDIIDWEELPPSMAAGGKDYFALEVKGDSMYPAFLEGDRVIIQKTDVCNSGDICVVRVNGDEATLKEIRIGKDRSLSLIPRNTNYAPRTYSADEIENLPVSIAGVVVELRRKIK